MMRKNENQILKTYKSKLSYAFLLSGGVSLILLLIYGICSLFFYAFKDYLFSDVISLLILAIFLTLMVGLLSPFIYSYFANYTILVTNKDADDKISLKSLFKTAKFGFFKPYRGLLSSFTNLLASILCYIILNSILSSIILSIFTSVDPAINNLFIQIETLITNGTNVNEIYDLISANEGLFVIPEMLSNFFTFLVVLFLFLRSMLKNIQKYTVIGSFMMLNKRQFNLLYKNNYRNHRKEFNKEFYSYSWPIFLSFFVIFIGSYFGMFFGFNLSYLNSFTFLLFVSLSSIVFGMIISLIFYPILFGYYIDSYPKMDIYMRTIFSNIFIQNVGTYINQATNANNDIKEAKESMKHMKEEQEKLKEEYDKLNIKYDENTFIKTDEKDDEKDDNKS